jgi:hypothetical protein
LNSEKPNFFSRLAGQSSFGFVLGYLSGMATLVMIVFWAQCTAAESAKAESTSEQPKKAAEVCKTTPGEAPATSSSERREVLDPSRFPGMASFGYASAKAAPEVMEKLFCYCGCDLTDKHSSLLDCFTGMHGIDCHICQEEAVLALKLKKDGLPIAEIQKAIDEKYSSEYPFQEETAAYKQYKAVRIYTKNSASTPARSSTEVAGPESPDNTAVSENPHLKPGKKVGKCCGAGDHEHTKKENTKQERTKT